ncbi:MAG: HAD family phosphatase [Bacteroidales bacterium]|jgi:HAD superfamily hydrolase (TIGR01509 family)|nr:HAD family phosphatase [Bacteroidales bacterium]
MQNKSIKNIIFDLGAVIININPDLTTKAMKKLGFNEFEKSYSLFKQTDIFDRLEKGLIDSEYLRNELRKHAKNEITDRSFDKAWGEMLLDFPKERINLIKELGKKYNIYLLSNTNAIHYRQYTQEFIDQYGFEFNSLFMKAYYSFQIGKRKPDVDIFEFAISDSKLLPEETLFIDDLQVNIESAKSIGLQTMLVDIANGDDIVNLLNGF